MHNHLETTVAFFIFQSAAHRELPPQSHCMSWGRSGRCCSRRYFLSLIQLARAFRTCSSWSHRCSSHLMMKRCCAYPVLWLGGSDSTLVDNSVIYLCCLITVVKHSVPSCPISSPSHPALAPRPGTSSSKEVAWECWRKRKRKEEKKGGFT